jgi:hypothetical protein
MELPHVGGPSVFGQDAAIETLLTGSNLLRPSDRGIRLSPNISEEPLKPPEAGVDDNEDREEPTTLALNREQSRAALAIAFTVGLVLLAASFSPAMGLAMSFIVFVPSAFVKLSGPLNPFRKNSQAPPGNDDSLAMPEGARWLARTMVALARHDSAGVIANAVEAEPIRVSDVEALGHDRPTMTRAELEKWSTDPKFIEAFRSALPADFHWQGREATLAFALLIQSGISRRAALALTPLITKHRYVITFNEDMTQPELNAALDLCRLFNRTAYIALPEHMRLPLERMLRATGKKLPVIELIQEDGRSQTGAGAFFLHIDGKSAFDAMSLQLIRKDLRMEDVALLHANKTLVLSGGQNVLQIDLNDLIPILARIDCDQIPALVRRILTAA